MKKILLKNVNWGGYPQHRIIKFIPLKEALRIKASFEFFRSCPYLPYCWLASKNIVCFMQRWNGISRVVRRQVIDEFIEKNSTSTPSS